MFALMLEWVFSTLCHGFGFRGLPPPMSDSYSSGLSENLSSDIFQRCLVAHIDDLIMMKKKSVLFVFAKPVTTLI